MVDNEGRASGVHYINRTTHEHGEVRAKIVVLAASTLESTRILLNSRTRRYPNGLGNSKGVLGHYLMDHFTIQGAGGTMASLMSSVREPTGNPAGFLIAKYANVGSNRKKNFLRGYRFDGDGSQELYAQAYSIPGYGKTFRERSAITFLIVLA